MLAFQSMKDFQEKPEKLGLEYGLFLVRNTVGLTAEILDAIHTETAKKGLLISLERLFKGLKSALVIYGPKDIVLKYAQQLRLIEIEDYTQDISPNDLVIWEMGVKDNFDLQKDIPNIFTQLPALNEVEQFWWQLIVQAKTSLPWDSVVDIFKKLVSKKDGKLVDSHKLASTRIANTGGKFSSTQTSKPFRCHIRTVLVASDPSRKMTLTTLLEKIGGGSLVKVPQSFTSSQILEFYKGRTLPFVSSRPFILEAADILKITLKPD